MLAVQSRDVESLTIDPRNARHHSPRNIEAIRASLRRFGQARPILITPDSVVIAGNGTLTAARAEGWTNIDAVQFDGTADEARAYALADNRTAELASWDQQDLIETLGELSADLVLAAGWTEDDLAKLIGDGDGEVSPQLGDIEYRIVVECANESEQRAILARLEADGVNCRAVMS